MYSYIYNNKLNETPNEKKKRVFNTYFDQKVPEMN